MPHRPPDPGRRDRQEPLRDPSADGEEADDPRPIWTIGHSTRALDAFVTLLEREHIALIADVRAFPASRRHPHFNGDALAAALNRQGIGYEHLPQLGGRRRAPADSPPTAWRNASFGAYAVHMRGDEFHAGLQRLLALAGEQRTAIMCSEAVPWRCHRNLIADALVARGVEVLHIGDAKATAHSLTSFAVVRDGAVHYPPEQEQLDLPV